MRFSSSHPLRRGRATDGAYGLGGATNWALPQTHWAILDPMICRVGHCGVLACAILVVCLTPLTAQKDSQVFQFSQFPIDVYLGHLKIPREFHKDRDGSWVDESGKGFFAPRVNFAGEYYLTAHSCGTCCRYYTLSNLRTGAEIDQIRMFDAGDPTPTTKDGRTFVPILFFKPDSRLLIVQYELDLCTVPVKQRRCRQRYFILKDGRFEAISKTFQFCTQDGDETE
jgi:hypothetical protein